MKHEKTFDAIDKLKEIESELHRLKNALELANRALEAEREACAKVCDEEGLHITASIIRARGQK